MKPEIEALWAGALKSGNYEQGTGCLRRGDRHCCLGVLCEVAIKNGLELSVKIDPEMDMVRYNGNGLTLPAAVAEWAGLPKGTEVPYSGGFNLAGKNDQGFSFDLIANLIETYGVQACLKSKAVDNVG